MKDTEHGTKLLREWLRSSKLCHTLDYQLGLDCSSFYRPQIIDIALELLGIEQCEQVDEIIEEYEKKIGEMNFYVFVGDGLNTITIDMLSKLMNYRKK